GFVYAIGNMPGVIQAVTYAIPARYLVTILKGIYLKGIGLSVLWADAALLAVFGAAVFFLANRKLRKKLV
ncbi:MAG TPA: hypothetical protein VJ386_10600, partial [Candidatus Deferrimicrobiaceae bacterium]|nr:hypothetical protein [Candidatus Deferrimicrobiaceae bacterium]